ncbi:MAG: YraN family protein [Rhodospirillales bacterium]|nr:YraN family protein [Alphaproteobacteria bacterium]MBL6928803.1 YraN family protein [Rhodospirillales bacterium]
MAGKPAPKRRAAWRFGLFAEHLAAALLRLKGYRILATRFKTTVGEIDIVARRADLIAFVEVKARADLAAAADALGPRQRQRIERAALAFMARHPHMAGQFMRFDVILVTAWKLPRHIIDAWRPD